ncbi:MAG TPA: hypothetical protein VMZ01_06725 [Aestuariivirga sp.]|nr:hypothetical protein [Aestuariivirga sp.]
MRELLYLSGQLHAHMLKEIEAMLSERLVLRYMSEARGTELLVKRDEELQRIDSWAEAQKEIVKEVFWAMIKEAETDKLMHVKAIDRLSVDSASLGAGAEQAALTHEGHTAQTAPKSAAVENASSVPGKPEWLQPRAATSGTLHSVGSLRSAPATPERRERRQNFPKAAE